MSLDLRGVAHALGGEVSGAQVLAPGPGHAPQDRSLSIALSPTAPDGFIVHSHAGDDWTHCRDYVRDRLGLPRDSWKREASTALGPIKAIYDYTDEAGKLLFQALRFDPKQFRQRTGPDQKKWSIDGVRIVPFRLPELIEDLALGHMVFVVEGEKDVLTLRGLSVPATTNPMGAGKWREQFNGYFRDADVVICGDNDKAGCAHVDLVARNLHSVARRVRILDLAQFWPDIAEGEDISDWLAKGGGTVEKLYEIVDGLTSWKPINGEPGPRSFAPLDGEARDPPPRIKLKSASAFCSEYTPLSYAVEPFVRSSSLYTLTAKTGAGKTALLAIMALAVSANRGDILGREITKGRVIYYSPENPDDLRMRLMVAAFVLNVDLEKLEDDLVIIDEFVKPEDLEAKLRAEDKPIALVIVDTLQAAFDGSDLNDNVQGGEFMRRLRRLTAIRGLPSVIVAAHPVKNASTDNLLPYGGGAMLNEVDGNLTLCATIGGITSLHWQGKLRGIDFTPALFRFEILDCPDVLDIKGRRVALPVLRPTTEEEGENREKAAVNRDVALLMAMAKEPRGTIRDWSDASSLTKAAVQRALATLATKKLVEKLLDKWTLTPAGQKVIKDREQ